MTAFRFPHLTIESLGDSFTDDFVAAPITGGLLMPNPIASSRRDAQFFGGTGLFNYPGYMESQFLAYYDSEKTADRFSGELYLAAENPDEFEPKEVFCLGGNSTAAGRVHYL